MPAKTPRVQKISNSTPKRITASKDSAQKAGPSDFICALATPGAGGKAGGGRSAIAIIRGSGTPGPGKADLFASIDTLFKTPGGETASALTARTTHYGFINDGNETVDDVLFIKFSGGASSTGEDSFEIHCHGNPLIIRKILELLYRQYFRPAEPGEFTRRAYLNGKLDLDAAQAIHEIVDARNAESLKAARRLRAGSFRREMLALRSNLMNLSADLNAELDFIDEDISFATRETKLKILADTLSAVRKINADAGRFDSFKAGVHIAIVGAPNAGKSSLMNRFLGEDRSIVSDIAGTTRDYIEAELEIAGFNVRLFDTAGLRESSDDPIERIGMERTRELMARAHICLMLVDGSVAPETGQAEKMPVEKGVRIIAVNKCDILHSGWANFGTLEDPSLCYISAKTGEGVEGMLEKIAAAIAEQVPTDALPLNLWQRQLLSAMERNLEDAANAIATRELPEVISHTVGLAVEKIAELTGEISSDDILGRIFSRFCIGK